MASLSTQDFTTLVRNMVAGVQASSSSLVNLTVGSVLRAVVESTAAVVLWLQGLVTYVLTLTRASTSSGSDLDSWMADYGFSRLAAVAATGQVTFSRYTNSAQAVVPFGAVVQTADGTQQFTVATDSTNAAYNVALGGYVLAIGVSSVTVGVVAVNAGTQGNVQASTINSIGQPISGADTVTNASAFANGVDAETDTAFRARFLLYIASLSKATKTAIGSAISSVQQGLSYIIVENYTYGGSYSPGFFYVVVDDGTRYPSGTLLSTIGNAIEAVRALSSTFAVFAPSVVTANVSMTVTTAAGYNHATVVGAVGTAIRSFINALPLAATLPYTQLAAIAYSIAGVTNVSAVLLNSATSDLVCTNQQAVLAGTVTVA